MSKPCKCISSRMFPHRADKCALVSKASKKKNSTTSDIDYTDIDASDTVSADVVATAPKPKKSSGTVSTTAAVVAGVAAAVGAAAAVGVAVAVAVTVGTPDRAKLPFPPLMHVMAGDPKEEDSSEEEPVARPPPVPALGSVVDTKQVGLVENMIKELSLDTTAEEGGESQGHREERKNAVLDDLVLDEETERRKQEKEEALAVTRMERRQAEHKAALMREQIEAERVKLIYQQQLIDSQQQRLEQQAMQNRLQVQQERMLQQQRMMMQQQQADAARNTCSYGSPAPQRSSGHYGSSSYSSPALSRAKYGTTQQGTTCKNCIKQGGRCHQHR